MKIHRRGILIAFAVFGTLCLLFWCSELAREGDQKFVVDLKAMSDLRSLARDMIIEGGSGVSKPNDQPFILSFAAFFDYVAKKRPQAVSTPDAPNPFPGILPGETYDRLLGVAHSGDDILISSKPFQRSLGNVTHFMRCNGTIESDIKKSQ